MYNLLYFIVIVLTLLWLSLCRESRGYYRFLPIKGIPYDNTHESHLVEEAVNHRTPSDILFHQKTDRSVSPVFLELLESNGIHHKHTVESFDSLLFAHVPTILRHKMFHNRARPWQVNPCIDKLDSISANNPSYPSGHAYQSWVLYKHLSEMYPHLERPLHDMAERCANIRVIAGLHFPSDGLYSKQLVMKKFNA